MDPTSLFRPSSGLDAVSPDLHSRAGHHSTMKGKAHIASITNDPKIIQPYKTPLANDSDFKAEIDPPFRLSTQNSELSTVNLNGSRTYAEVY